MMLGFGSLVGRAAAWRLPWRVAAVRRRWHSPGLRWAVTGVLLVLLLPVLMLIGGVVFAALGGEDSASLTAARLWRHTTQTLLYVGGVAVVALLLAVPAAWMTVLLNFPYRRLFVWLLFLPFALPPYLTAYVYADMAAALGAHPPPMAMAIATTALATYPYIYFMMRYALRQQHCHIASAGRLLGCSPWGALRRISLPLAKPAMMVGLTLVVLEALNDIAIAEFFGIATIGIGIYDLWLNRNDFGSAANLALMLMLAVYVIVRWEEKNRQRQKQYGAACDRCFECERAVPVRGGARWAVCAALLLPAVAGFVLPVVYLIRLSAAAPAAVWADALATGIGGSLFLAAALLLLLLGIGVLFVMDKRFNRTRHFLTGFIRIVYALPGAVLAQGVFVLAAAVAAASGNAVSLWTAGGGFVLLLLAGCSRFFILAGGTLEVGMDKISQRLDDTAKLAAMNPLATFVRVHLPLLRTTLATVAVMVFLEAIKELPMTLILRPFNFETLATVIYQYASDETLALAAPAALLLAAAAAAAVSVLFALESRDSRGEH